MIALLIGVTLYVLFIATFVIAWSRWQNAMRKQDVAESQHSGLPAWIAEDFARQGHHYTQQQWRDKLHAKYGRKYGH
jgi:hypothetical protein